jgi:hypothetical protein
MIFQAQGPVWHAQHFRGKQDYWATPLEVLGRAKGGCEDFAIAVCVTLKLLGILSEKRRMTYVKARIGGAQSIRDQAHRVLSHYPAPGDEPLGLDMLNPDSWPTSRRSDLTVVFGFNTKGLGGRRSQSPCSQHVATALEMAVGHCQDAGGRSHLKTLVLRAMSCH